MTWRWGHGQAAIVIGLLLLASLGCSSADPIQSANVNVSVVAAAAPAYAGTYQWARLQIDQMTLRPLDAQANSYLEIPLGFQRTFAAMDVRSSADVAVATTPLRAGSYQIEALRFSQLSLNVANTAPTLSTGCSGTDLVEVWVGSAVVVQFAVPPRLQVLQDGSTQVNIVVDGPGFVQMLTGQPYTCGLAFPTPTSDQVAQIVTVH